MDKFLTKISRKNHDHKSQYDQLKREKGNDRINNAPINVFPQRGAAVLPPGIRIFWKFEV